MMKDRVNELDLLRFCAALSVVFYHYAFRGYAADHLTIMPYPLLTRFAKYGNVGVSLFFMISGYVILMTAAEGSLKKFVVSRMIRLYPAFWICCTATFLVAIAIGGEKYFTTASQYLVNLTMLSEFFNVQPVDWAYWSLFVEIKFYLLIAIILLIGKIDWAQNILIAWLSVSICLEFVYQNGYLYYWLNAQYATYFIAGAMCFLISTKGPSLTRMIVIVIAWGLAVMQAISDTTLAEKRFKTPMNEYIIVAIITLFFVIMFLISIKKTGAVGRVHWSAIGALTYPIYLLHQNIGYMIFNVAYPAINSHVLFWSVIILMVCMAYMVNIFEKKVSPPFKNALYRFFNYLEQLKNRPPLVRTN